jgi:hypothetical protein
LEPRIKLLVAIGKRCSNVSEDEDSRLHLGCTGVNDVTAAEIINKPDFPALGSRQEH